MRLAWFTPHHETAADEVVVVDDADQLSVLAATGRPGVAWWIPNRYEPSVAEAVGRLAFLERHGASPYAFPASPPQPPLVIRRVWLDDVDVQLLISQLNMDLHSRYPEPGALVFSLDAADIVDGVGTLLMAELDGEPVGCGAYRILDDQPGTAEVKRLYVTLAGRGKQVGRALLAELERGAAAFGVERLVLETGPRQPEAMRVFESRGFAVCAPWGQFVGKEYSICMEKVGLPANGGLTPR